MNKVKLKLTKREDGWWITNMPEGCEECGPYKTRAEAADDKHGLENTFANWDNRSFWTSDKRRWTNTTN